MQQQPDLKPELDFNDLLRRPEKLFGYTYLYFAGALLVLGMLYAWNLNAIGKNGTQPVMLKDSSAFVLEIPLKSPVNLPPVDVKKAGVESPELVAKGRELFRANCVSCHGDNGLGDGVTAGTLNPKPRNFHSLDGWKNGSKVSQVYKTLQEGIAGAGMSSYNYMPPEDRFALAHYVRTFAPGQPLDSEQDLTALETTYQLSKGSLQAGQVPVKKAALFVMNETAGRADTILSLIQNIHSEVSDEGAIVLRRMAVDPQKVLSALYSRRAGFPSLEQFVFESSLDPNLMGLKPSVTQLTDAEWEQLYRYLTRLLAPKESSGPAR